MCLSSLFVEKSGTSHDGGKCADIDAWGQGPRINVYNCAHSANQMWERRIDPKCSEEDVAAIGRPCSQLINVPTNHCLTRVQGKTLRSFSIPLDDIAARVC